MNIYSVLCDLKQSRGGNHYIKIHCTNESMRNINELLDDVHMTTHNQINVNAHKMLHICTIKYINIFPS